MGETVHNWDIEALREMREEIQKVRNILAENRDLIVSEGFEILQNWQGKAGQKFLFVTAANAGKVDSLIKRYDQLNEQLGTVINQCYSPCEEEIMSKISQLGHNWR
ncbi:MAG: hypothetical protein NC452_08285 [Eubacterium sp.]|nr:hypothetical protein [Eubacterium sp.]